MKRVIGFGIGGLVLLFLIFGIARTRQSEEVQSISNIQQQDGVPVYATTVERGTVQRLQSYYGTVRSKEQANVTAKLMERVDKVLVDEGDRVKKGDLLVRFAATNSQAMVAQAKLQYQNMKRDYDRMKKLLDEGAISQQTFDQVRLGYQVAKENYESAKSNIDLTAPISGIVARVNFAEGVLAFPGDVVVQIVNDGAYEIKFDATQEDRNLLHPGQTVYAHTNGDESVVGTLTKVSFASAEDTRLFSAYADIPGSSAIYPGVLATVDVVVKESPDVVQVPVEAVIDRGKGSEVIVIKDGKADVRKVTLGLVGENMIEIQSGLNAGEQIATYGQSSLESGQKVKIIQNAVNG